MEISAQIPMGTWRMFTPNKDTRGIERLGDKIFVAFENGLLEYDIESSENSLWTATNLLSEVSLSALEVHSPTKTLVVAYENGNLDLIQNNILFNLPALVLATVPGDKRINKMLSHEEFVYVACGIGIMKLNPERREIADTYYELLSDVILPMKDSKSNKSSWHLYVIRTTQRDNLMNFLKENGISTGVHYKPIHLYKCYDGKCITTDLTNTNSEWKKIISLPIFLSIKKEEQNFISKKIEEFNGTL
jgi:hypothetical protein